MRGGLERMLLDGWRRRGLLAWVLGPVSLVYWGLLTLKCALYRLGLLKSERLGVPVIVVGNVIAGGAGKTPATLAIAEYLQESGWRPGIISRGYGRRTVDCREVTTVADPLNVGDEALLLRRRTGLPVFVAARRAEAGKALLAAYPGVNVLVCDDGLQHLALARDVEVCVFDARGVGNGWLMPAGPLREPWPRPVDFVLHAPDAVLSSPPAHSFSVCRTLAAHGVHADGTEVLLAGLRGQPITALAGIAQPEAFFSMLRAEGLTLARTIALPDHDDFSELPTLPGANEPLVCTEKDAAKLWRHRPDALAVPLILHVPDAFLAELSAKLSSGA